VQLKNADQILAEEKHLPLYEVRLASMHAARPCCQRSCTSRRRVSRFGASSSAACTLSSEQLSRYTLQIRHPHRTCSQFILHSPRTLCTKRCTPAVTASWLSTITGQNGDQVACNVQELSKKSDVQYVAGGATQNTMRVAQWMLKEPGSTAYMGCIGKDAYADKLRDVCSKAGVDSQYMVDESTPTGTCAVCVLDKDRSLVANLGAANNYKVRCATPADLL
jgi:pfkB family carbohydrate kinase